MKEEPFGAIDANGHLETLVSRLKLDNLTFCLVSKSNTKLTKGCLLLFCQIPHRFSHYIEDLYHAVAAYKLR